MSTNNPINFVEIYAIDNDFSLTDDQWFAFKLGRTYAVELRINRIEPLTV